MTGAIAWSGTMVRFSSPYRLPTTLPSATRICEVWTAGSAWGSGTDPTSIEPSSRAPPATRIAAIAHHLRPTARRILSHGAPAGLPAPVPEGRVGTAGAAGTGCGTLGGLPAALGRRRAGRGRRRVPLGEVARTVLGGPLPSWLWAGARRGRDPAGICGPGPARCLVRRLRLA